jgi:ubiquinone/menaquinone biosynthesis C-methylase UbiE
MFGNLRKDGHGDGDAPESIADRVPHSSSLLSESSATETVSDYFGYDFAALWRGRGKVTEVERAIVAEAVRSSDARRVLEVGTGFGRLLPAFGGIAGEVVATDYNLEGLVRLPTARGETTPTKVAVNVYHLPFVPASFTCAVMVRVHHHLSDPSRALAELARVLAGRGRIVVSYNPRPSVGTLVQDLQRALRTPRGTRFRSVTFATAQVTLAPSPFPVFIGSRLEFARIARGAGLRPVAEVGSGYEEFRVLRSIPARSFVRLGRSLGRAPAFPTRFAILEKAGAPVRPPLPEVARIFACPRCESPRPEWGEPGPLVCALCSFEGERSGDVLDLRYVPPGTPRWAVNDS